MEDKDGGLLDLICWIWERHGAAAVRHSGLKSWLLYMADPVSGRCEGYRSVEKLSHAAESSEAL